MTIIYIVSPKSFTGGPESLHQLGKSLLDSGLDARIYYTNGYQRFNYKFDNQEVSPRLQAYGIPSVEKILDDEDNILVVPEVYVGLFNQFKNIRKCIWWLSLEYYFHSFPEYTVQHSKKLRYVKPILRPLYHIYLDMRNHVNQYTHLTPINQHNIYHMYNCESVRQYLSKIGICENNMIYLCGPIEEIYFTQPASSNTREDIVLYNPKKGIEFTKKILKAAEGKLKNVKFIPIQNMNAHEIVNIMDKSKVYMDFGYFPGPERIPREAVIRGCCIITSRTGCAGNSVDVPIPERFKIEAIDENITEIIDRINELICQYDILASEYEEYKYKVELQKDRFKDGTGVFLKHYCLEP